MPPNFAALKKEYAIEGSRVVPFKQSQVVLIRTGKDKNKIGVIHKTNPKTLDVKFRRKKTPVRIKKKICKIVDWRPGYSNIPGTVVADTTDQNNTPLEEFRRIASERDIDASNTARRDTIMTIAAEIIHSDDMWRTNKIFHVVWRRIKADVASIQWNRTPWDEFNRMPAAPEPIQPDRYQGLVEPYKAKPWRKIRTSLQKFLYYPGAQELAYGRDWLLACEEIETSSCFRHDDQSKPAAGRKDEDVCQECHKYTGEEAEDRTDWCPNCF
jgi:hypothetical protein